MTELLYDTELDMEKMTQHVTDDPLMNLIYIPKQSEEMI